MKLDRHITGALRLLRRGKNGDAIHALEIEIFRYPDSFIYYYILGAACLRAEKFNDAFTYLKRAHEIDVEDPRALLGLAVLFLHLRDTAKAVDRYLEVQELAPKNRISKNALQVIRKHGGAENIAAWIETGKLPQLYPPLPKIPFSIPRLLISLAVILFIAAAGLLIRLEVITPFNKNISERQGFSGSVLEWEERKEPVQIEGSYRYVLTRNEVVDTYNTARKLFTEFRDESAKLALNRILESNASEAIKNKARLLKTFTEQPGFDTLKDRFSYTEVHAEPALYRDCYVVWRGMAANLDAGQNGTAFNLLVGYDTRRTLEGIVPVHFDSAIPVNTERPLEVLGRIVPVSTAGGGMDIRIEGTAVHQSGLLVPDNPAEAK
ncbi:hypothetical protein FACS189473_1700 [Spirochaetia bacterium]|nr:hypothetical protein FACS189473_1700 [Spirochaetia bacterium]